MGWVSPTGHNDPNSKYTDETKAYDNNTATRSITLENGYYLELLHASILCDKIRIYASVFYSTSSPPYAFWVNPDVTIWIYYGGGWTSIFSGLITTRTWIQKSIGSDENVTKMRVKFNNIGTGHIIDMGEIYEIKFNDITPAGIARPKVGGSLVGSSLVGKGLV